MSNKLFEHEVKQWLKQNCPRYELLEWGGGSSFCSKFLDTTRNIEFISQFSILKRNLKRNPNTIFNPTKEEMIEVNKKISLDKYGVEHFSKTNEYKEKSKKTSLKKYGVENAMKNKEIKEKLKQTNLKKFGVEFPLQNEKIKEKQKQTTMQRYGCISPFEEGSLKEKFEKTMLERYNVLHPQRNSGIREKTINTNIERYGVKVPLQNKEILNKMKETMEEKYGTEFGFQSEEIKKKIKRSLIDRGYIKFYQGRSVKEWAQEKQYSRTHFNKLVNELGFKEAVKLDPTKTSIESLMQSLFQELDVKYIFNRQLDGCQYRPDFILEDHKLIIECDGLYWHSDMIIKNKKYHKEKKEEYDKLEYRSLFFHEDEILNKLHIIKSIIQNKLNMSQKIFARKTKIYQLFDKTLSNKFFEDNHLMGKGSGRVYILHYNNDTVAAIQVKNKKDGIEISRFCTKNGISVVGGFSKLISHVKKIENPKQITTFIDKRYGSGNYLLKLGFIKENEDLSFMWINGEKTYHRMNFKGNSGYEYGLFKLWDCGQAKYVLK